MPFSQLTGWQMFTDYGHFVINTLHIPRGTKTAALVQTYVAFAISGIIHAQASYSLRPVPPFTGFYDRFTCLLIYFMLQAVGLNIEDVAISAYNALYGNFASQTTKVKPSDAKENENFGLIPRWAPWLGRLWVISWCLITGQWALNAWLKTEQGMLRVPGTEQGSIAGRVIGLGKKYNLTYGARNF
jgi:hypothetical protein